MLLHQCDQRLTVFLDLRRELSHQLTQRSVLVLI